MPEYAKSDPVHHVTGETSCDAAVVLEVTHQFPWDAPEFRAKVRNLVTGAVEVVTASQVHTAGDCPNRLVAVSISDSASSSSFEPIGASGSAQTLLDEVDAKIAAAKQEIVGEVQSAVSEFVKVASASGIDQIRSAAKEIADNVLAQLEAKKQ